MIHSSIWSVVALGSKVWTIDKEIWNKINSFEAWIYHRILEISWKDRVSNEEVLQKIGIDGYLMDSIAKRKAAFFECICRGSNGDDFVAIVEVCIEGIRTQDRIIILHFSAFSVFLCM